MTKITYTATDANGDIHTRTTERVYSHVVLVQDSKENAIKQANKHVAWNLEKAREEFAYAVRTIEECKAVYRAKRCDLLARNDDYAIECITKGKAFVAQWGTVEAFAAAKHVEEIAKIEATDWNTWGPAGWCGRLDLAEKLAAKERGNAYRHAVVILPAVEARKAAAKKGA